MTTPRYPIPGHILDAAHEADRLAHRLVPYAVRHAAERVRQYLPHDPPGVIAARHHRLLVGIAECCTPR